MRERAVHPVRMNRGCFAAFAAALAALALSAAGAAAGKGAAPQAPDSLSLDASIASFESVLRRYPESAMRAPTLLLVGDLYAEREKTRYLRAVLHYEENAAEGKPAGEAPVLDYVDAIRCYREAARLDRDSETGVEALHALGVCLDEMGRTERAERSLLEAARRAGDPALRAASLVRLGSLRFSNGDWGGALEAYRGAREAGADPVAEKLDYRIGWCHLKRGELEEAGAGFRAALRRAAVSILDDPRGESLSEILRSLALVQVETDPSDIKGYAASFPAGLVRRAAVAEFGGVLLDHDRAAQAERAYRMALRMEKAGSAAPELQDKVIETLSAQDRKREAGLEMERAVDLYGPGAAWWASRETTGDLALDVKERVLRNCWNGALLRFEAGTEEDLRRAALFFSRYVEELGGVRDRSRARLYAAEAWDRLGEAEKSAACYARVIPGELPEAEREFAYRGAVLAEQAVGGMGAGMAAAAVRYVDAYPNSEEAWKSLLLAADREETAGRLRTALDLSARAADGAGPPLRFEAELRAARLAAQAGDRAAAEAWYLRSSRSATGEKERMERLERAAASALLAAADLEQEARWPEAAEACARVSREYRGTATGRDALVEEIACRARFDSEAAVVAIADTAVTLLAGSEEARRGLGAAARHALAANRPLLAARLHESAYRVLPLPEDLLEAGSAYESAGDLVRARSLLERAAASAAGTSLGPEAFARLGKRCWADGEPARAARAFDRAMETGAQSRRVEFLAQGGAAWLEAGETKRATNRLEQAVALHASGAAKGDAEQAYAAEAYISLARAGTREWEGELRAWRQGGSSTRAERRLERVIGLYQAAIDLRFEGTTEAAAVEAGALLERFGASALLRERDAGGPLDATLVEPHFRNALVLFRSAGDAGKEHLLPYEDLADTLIAWGETRVGAAPCPVLDASASEPPREEEVGPALEAAEDAGNAWAAAADLLRMQEEAEPVPGISSKRTSLALRAGEVLREGAELLRAAPVPGGLSKKDAELYRSLVEQKARGFEERASAWDLALPGAMPDVIPPQASRAGGFEGAPSEGVSR